MVSFWAILSNNYCNYFLATLGEKLGYFQTNIWSHWSNQMCSCDIFIYQDPPESSAEVTTLCPSSLVGDRFHCRKSASGCLSTKAARQDLSRLRSCQPCLAYSPEENIRPLLHLSLTKNLAA